MTGFSLRWDVSDLERLNAALVSFNPKDVYRQIGEQLRSEALLRFRQEVSPKGEKWKPSKRAQAQGGQTLVDKAILKNSLTYAITGEGLEFGPGPLRYAAIHQFGGKAGRGRKVRIPRRQYIPEPEDFTDVDLKRMGDAVIKALVSHLGQA